MKNARNNDVENVYFHRADAGEFMVELAAKDEHNFKKKVWKKYFNVSVVINLECGDTRNH